MGLLLVAFGVGLAVLALPFLLAADDVSQVAPVFVGAGAFILVGLIVKTRVQGVLIEPDPPTVTRRVGALGYHYIDQHLAWDQFDRIRLKERVQTSGGGKTSSSAFYVDVELCGPDATVRCSSEYTHAAALDTAEQIAAFMHLPIQHAVADETFVPAQAAPSPTTAAAAPPTAAGVAPPATPTDAPPAAGQPIASDHSPQPVNTDDSPLLPLDQVLALQPADSQIQVDITGDSLALQLPRPHLPVSRKLLIAIIVMLMLLPKIMSRQYLDGWQILPLLIWAPLLWVVITTSIRHTVHITPAGVSIKGAAGLPFGAFSPIAHQAIRRVDATVMSQIGLTSVAGAIVVLLYQMGPYKPDQDLPPWLRATLRTRPTVRLITNDRNLEFGRALHPADRLWLRDTLRSAIAQHQNE